MKLTTISCLVAALSSATSALADAIQDAQAATITPSPRTTPAPELIDDESQPHIEIRQNNVQNPAATINPEQVPVITTQWIESTIGSGTTYVQVIYTQLFSSVPDQWPSAQSGSIGYGTLKKTGAATKTKRDVEARETGLAGSTFVYAQPVVLVMQDVVVTQYVQPVQEVLILSTITVVPNATDGVLGTGANMTDYGNGTGPISIATYNDTNSNTTDSAPIAITTTLGSLQPVAYNYTYTPNTGSGISSF